MDLPRIQLHLRLQLHSNAPNQLISSWAEREKAVLSDSSRLATLLIAALMRAFDAIGVISFGGTFSGGISPSDMSEMYLLLDESLVHLSRLPPLL